MIVVVQLLAYVDGAGPFNCERLKAYLLLATTSNIIKLNSNFFLFFIFYIFFYLSHDLSDYVLTHDCEDHKIRNIKLMMK